MIRESHIQFKDELTAYLETQSLNHPIDANDLYLTYTQSAEYLIYTTHYHLDPGMPQLLSNLLSNIPKSSTITDLGCCSGITGLFFANQGYQVTFRDFEGLGLTYINHYIKSHNLTQSTKILPYGTLEDGSYKTDWLLALDVLEHTHNHLSFLRWLENLSNSYIVLTYPLTDFIPPHTMAIDGYVDDEIIQLTIAHRYKIEKNYLENGRRFIVYRLN